LGVLADWQLRELGEKGMISPFEPTSVKEVRGDLQIGGKDLMKKVISYGTSSYGYDARLAPEFKVFTPVSPDGGNVIMDPKNPDPRCFVDVNADELILPPNGYALGVTMETFEIPEDVIVICLGKSTYARTGLIVNVTPLEPGWRGQVTLEFANCLPIPTKLYAHEGICQFLFMRGEKPCEDHYGKRSGKYQDQKGIVTARL
jgi:dCTP deaminase